MSVTHHDKTPPQPFNPKKCVKWEEKIKVGREKEHFKTLPEYYPLIRPSFYGWSSSINILALILKWFRLIRPNYLEGLYPVTTFQVMLKNFEKTDVNHSNMITCSTWNKSREPPYGKSLSRRTQMGIHMYDIFPSITAYDSCRSAAIEYLLRNHKQELLDNVPRTIIKKSTYEENGIIFSSSRIAKNSEVINLMDGIDASSIMIQEKLPFLYRWSPITLALVRHLHDKVTRHRGVDFTRSVVNSCCHIHRGGYIVKRVVNDCIPCRLKNKIKLKVSMGPITSKLRYSYVNHTVFVDGSGPYFVSRNTLGVGTRSRPGTVKVWFLHFACAMSHYTCVEALEDFSTEAFVLAFARFCAQLATPCVVYLDSDASELKGLRETDFNIGDVGRSLFSSHHTELRLCGTMGDSHSRHGLIERRIRSQKAALNSMTNIMSEMTISSLLTAMKISASYLNSCPLGLKQRSSHSEIAQFLTPNSFLIGIQSSETSLLGMGLTKNRHETLTCVEKFCKGMCTFFSSFMTSFLLKNDWSNNKPDKIGKGDLVLFEHTKSPLGSNWKLGNVSNIELDSDEEPRILELEYNLSQEIKYPKSGTVQPEKYYLRPRFSRRGTSTVARIYHQDDPSINGDLEYLADLERDHRKENCHNK